MERRRLGKTDMVVSVLGFGGSEIGYQQVGVRTVGRLLGSAIDAGLNVIDTAECYDDSEILIGRAIGGRRRECYLFTKCGHARGWGREDWRLAPILASIERSLRRLQTDYLDLIQLHSCSLAELQRGDAIMALEQARARGAVRFIGYSGDGEAARYAVECGRFDTLQTSVSIADQEPLELTLPLARAQDMGVIAKRPLANVAWGYARKPAESYYQTYWARLRKLDYPFLRKITPRWVRPFASPSPWPASTPRSSGQPSPNGGSRTRPFCRRVHCRMRSSPRSASAGRRPPIRPGWARCEQSATDSEYALRSIFPLEHTKSTTPDERVRPTHFGDPTCDDSR